jgi:hypothetical protein
MDNSTKYPKFAVGCLAFDLICTATTMAELATGKVGTNRLIGFEAIVQAHCKAASRHIGMELADLCLAEINRNPTLETLEKIETQVVSLAQAQSLELIEF